MGKQAQTEDGSLDLVLVFARFPRGGFAFSAGGPAILLLCFSAPITRQTRANAAIFLLTSSPGSRLAGDWNYFGARSDLTKRNSLTVRSLSPATDSACTYKPHTGIKPCGRSVQILKKNAKR